MKYDFGGYATKNDLLCSDGRVIRRDAFKECDGKTVPLVWNHMHDDPENVLGHADLENRPDGVYAYCSFNKTDKASAAKESVRNGDICSLSIYANHLQQNGHDVIHGAIREVSLVLAGANPGAEIEQVAIQHSDDSVETLDDEAVIKPWVEIDSEEVEFAHSDDSKSPEDFLNSLTEDQKKKLSEILKDDTENQNETKKEETLSEDEKIETPEEAKPESEPVSEESVEHSDDASSKDTSKEDAKMADSTTDTTKTDTTNDKTVQDVYDAMSDEQKTVVQYLVGLALQEAQGDETDQEAAQSDTYGGNDMYHNAFEDNDSNTLSHSDIEGIKSELFANVMDDVKHGASFRDSVIAHAAGDYGIKNISVLFPDAQNVTDTPQFMDQQAEWVNVIMSATKHVPFAKFKTTVADITAADARAKGYIKGKAKVEEFFSVAKRETTPQTVYKKQKMDRDDIVDITDFDVVNWIRTEMRVKLNEELGRAFLIGDGRSAEAEDKINEEHIRPIANDVDLFNVKVDLSQVTDYAKVIEEIALAHSYYRGTGTPMFFTSPTTHTKMLWVKDTMGRRLYASEAELCAALRVSQIVDVPDMETLTRVVGTDTYSIVGIKVNPADYTVGADKGGEINNFDDFDIDYNQYKYLMETRCSAGLTIPWSAETVRFNTTTAPTKETISSGSIADLK